MNFPERLKLQKWAQEVAEQADSGLSRKAWCRSKGISESTFRYHKRRVLAVAEEELESQTNMIASTDTNEITFAKIPEGVRDAVADVQTGRAAIRVTFHHATVEIEETAPCDQLRTVLEVLSHA